MDAQAKRAALFLLLATGPLAEILSENQPLLAYLTPPNCIILTLVYGVPILLIRELAAAKKLSIAGIILLGMAYGILNEGVLAKTLTQPAGEPVTAFAGYGKIGVFQGGWATMIVFWHALHSVLYPILYSRWLFPAVADKRWFGKRGTAGLLLILTCIYGLYFLFIPERAYISMFIAYLLASLAFVALALRFCRIKDDFVPAVSTPAPLKPALVGAAMIFLYVFQFVAANRAPFALFLAIPAAVIWFGARSIRRAAWRSLPQGVLFALGDDLTFSAFTATICVTKGKAPVQIAIAGVIFFVLFVAMMRAVRKAPAGRIVSA